MDSVNTALNKGAFLRGHGNDPNVSHLLVWVLINSHFHQGRPQNLCHPCIPHMIHEFYYNAKNSLARGEHASDFEDIIPENAVAAVIVAVYFLRSFFLK